MTLLEQVKEALEPFAEKAGDYIYEDPAHHGIVFISDLRRARAALAALEAAGGEEMVEKIARLIHSMTDAHCAWSDPHEFGDTPHLLESGREGYRVIARAALATVGVK